MNTCYSILPTSKHKLVTALILVCLGVSQWSLAAGPTPSPGGGGHWWVGSGGSQCDFDNIQDAIDATVANDGGFDEVTVFVTEHAAPHVGNTYSINAADFDNVNTFRINGGMPECGVFGFEPARTTLDADGNDRVFDLFYLPPSGSPARTVELRNLELRGGSTSGDGGGIRIRGEAGRQQIRLENVRIVENEAGGVGGGIHMQALADANIFLANWLETNQVRIANNHAAAGAGLYCRTDLAGMAARVRISSTAFEFNEAVHSGGGLQISGCRNFLIQTDEIANSRIFGNMAGQQSQFSMGGGGLVVVNDARVMIRTGPGASEPALIAFNTADIGGALHVSSGALLQLANARISQNLAMERGGGISVTNGGRLEMDRQGGSGVEMQGDCLPMTSMAAKCSRIDGNHALGPGGAIAVIGESGGDTVARLDQTFIQDNLAEGLGSVGFVRGPLAELHMEGSVVFGNHGSSRVFQLEDQSLTGVDLTTIAGNHDPDRPVQIFRLLNSQDNSTMTRLRVRGSIIWEPQAAQLINRSGPTFTPSNCTITHLSLADSGFSVGSQFYSQIDPRLVDPDAGDLRLQADSPAIDYCGVASFGFTPAVNDMFNQTRGVAYNLPTINPPNPGFGNFDLGAHELQPFIDKIFEDRFEDP